MKLELSWVPNFHPPTQLPPGITLGAFSTRSVEGDRRLYREARANCANENALLALWKNREVKEQFLRRGFNMGERKDAWILFQWLRPHGDKYTLTPNAQQRLDDFLMPRTTEDTPLPPMEFAPLPYGLESKLRGYQVQPARQLWRALSHGKEEWNYPGTGDLSDAGTGKTYSTLAVALASGRKVIVLCPVVGHGGWERAFKHFGAEPHFLGSYEGVRGGFRPHIAYEHNDTFYWKNSSDIIIILDEAQAVRNKGTLTYRCCEAAIRQGIPIIIASATVATSPLEMAFLGRITGLHKGGDDFNRFLLKHGAWRPSASAEWKWDGGLHHLDRIRRELFPRRGARVRKEDLGAECPETKIELLPIDTDDADAIQQDWRECEKIIDTLKKQGKATLAQERNLRMAIWQRCEMSIVPHIAPLVRADLAEGRSVALFMAFTASRLALGGLLKNKDGFYGGQNIQHRKRLEDDFQANKIHLLINQIAAGGASVSLHDIHGERPRVAYVFPTDNPVQFSQATGRVDRVGGQSVSLQFIPYVRGAMTQKMVERTREKIRRISVLNDGQGASSVAF